MNRRFPLALAAATGVVLLRRRAQKPTAIPYAPPAPVQGRTRTVPAEDGVELAVTEHGSQDAAVTVVLAHGYVQSSALWSGQVRDLLAARPDLKVVTYDHRGHGASGRSTASTSNLEQLARDLERVLDSVAPTGPVVLAGHSMGGMTIMALAEQAPELFGDRVKAVAFVGTSSGRLAEVTWGLPAPAARVVKALLPRLNEKARRDELKGKTRKPGAVDARLLFPKSADRALVREALDVQAQTPAETVAWFLPTFSQHDRLEVLKALEGLPVVVVAGDQDLLCPLPHSKALAAALPGARLVVYPGVGHMVQMERRAGVSRQLLDLVEQVTLKS
ncbi:MAG: Pimeloyl-ACP methyl ester carboxylesterase [Frankiales bacterium]|jgi:pimeloyl-ACP methyl ester carboxylesterase|nr:Pimeloyl-ACP methyl ester carboxylesterase [Frankiales bacterium]